MWLSSLLYPGPNPSFGYYYIVKNQLTFLLIHQYDSKNITLNHYRQYYKLMEFYHILLTASLLPKLNVNGDSVRWIAAYSGSRRFPLN